MINPFLISEKYASMPDRELLLFAKEEGSELTAEGRALLQKEFIKRNLNTDLIDGPVNPTNVANHGNMPEVYTPGFASTLWTYAFEEKESGKTNEDIVAGLMEHGMDEANALQLISGIGVQSKRRLKKAELLKLTGGLVFISGIAVTFLPLPPGNNTLTYIAAWSAIFFGAGRSVKGVFYKSRFKKILQNIALQNKREDQLNT